MEGAIAAAERRGLEVEAMRHIFGEEAVRSDLCRTSSAGCNGHDKTNVVYSAAVCVLVEFQAGSGCGGRGAHHSHQLRADFRLPEGYPEESPPAVTVSCPELRREHVAELQEAAERCVAEVYISPPGRECMFDIVSHLQDSAALLLVPTSDPAAGDTSTQSLVQAAGEACLLMVRIDHMNSPQKYIRLLKKWASGLSLSGELLLSTKPDGRAQNIALLLLGEEPNLQAFLARLRTEHVDVNSRGDKCKERQSDVLCSLSASALSSDMALGLAVIEYGNREELETLLTARCRQAMAFWPKQ